MNLESMELVAGGGAGCGPASVVFGSNPFLESRLRSQFGDAFFTDFGVSVEKDGTVGRFVLTSKYIQAGRMLGKNVDEAFYDLLAEMEAELIRGGHSTEIIAEIEATYEQARAEKSGS